MELGQANLPHLSVKTCSAHRFEDGLQVVSGFHDVLFLVWCWWVILGPAFSLFLLFGAPVMHHKSTTSPPKTLRTLKGQIFSAFGQHLVPCLLVSPIILVLFGPCGLEARRSSWAIWATTWDTARQRSGWVRVAVVWETRKLAKHPWVRKPFGKLRGRPVGRALWEHVGRFLDGNTAC